MSEEFYTGIQHVGIPTGDLPATIEFYQTLGFDVVREEYLKESDCRVCFLKLKNLVIETYDSHEAAIKAGAVDHIALDVNDINGAWKFAGEKKLKILEEEIVSLPFWSNGIKCFKVEGPNKEKVEFCQIL